MANTKTASHGTCVTTQNIVYVCVCVWCNKGHTIRWSKFPNNHTDIVIYSRNHSQSKSILQPGRRDNGCLICFRQSVAAVCVARQSTVYKVRDSCYLRRDGGLRTMLVLNKQNIEAKMLAATDCYSRLNKKQCLIHTYLW